MDIGGDSNPETVLNSPVIESCVLFLLLSRDFGLIAACKRSFPSELPKNGGMLPVSIGGIPDVLKFIPPCAEEVPVPPEDAATAAANMDDRF